MNSMKFTLSILVLVLSAPTILAFQSPGLHNVGKHAGATPTQTLFASTMDRTDENTAAAVSPKQKQQSLGDRFAASTMASAAAVATAAGTGTPSGR